MGFYPVFLDLEGRCCLVVGGGLIAERRVHSLLEAGASVTIVSPALTPALADLAASGRVRHLARAYQAGDLAGAALAFVAVDDGRVTPAVASEARARGVWLNAADDPTHCSFYLPGVVRRGVLTVAVGSGGASPALTRAAREHLDGVLGREWATLGELAAGARRDLRATGRAADAEAWRHAVAADVRALLAEGRVDDARGRLRARLELPA
jgi:precorrin-2 dehydrogenase/sirohydrochlorin ferrochelatase